MLSKLFFSEAIKILSNFVCYIFKGCSQFICIGVSNFSKGAKMQILSIAYLVIEHTCKFPGALLCIHTVLEPQHPQAVSYNRPPCLKKKKQLTWPNFITASSSSLSPEMIMKSFSTGQPSTFHN